MAPHEVGGRDHPGKRCRVWGGWMVSNLQLGWGEHISRCREALGRCWQQKRLPEREWEMIFGLFCGSPLDIIGDGECMGSWFGLGAVGVTVGC